MNLIEIKKALYREKPTAKRTAFNGDYKHYVTQLKDKTIVIFHVPNNESDNFDNEISAQLLIRWIKK